MVFSSLEECADKVHLAFSETPKSDLLIGLADDHDLSIFLSGGFVRDALLTRGKARDVDLTVPGNVRMTARLWADTIGGTVVPLDPDRGIYRVAGKGKGGPCCWDFTSFRSSDILEDLRLRDFTVNAMAVSLRPRGKRLLDPTNGLPDLKGKIIRQAYKNAFIDDPLRKLRAFRLAAQLGFALAPETLPLLEGKNLIEQTAGERIRQELTSLLSLPASVTILPQFIGSGLLSPLLPSEYTSLAGYKRFEKLVCRSSTPDLTSFLFRKSTNDIIFAVLLKLALLVLPPDLTARSMALRDWRPVMELGKRLRLGKKAELFLRRSVTALGHLQEKEAGLGKSAETWLFFDEYGDAGLGGLILLYCLEKKGNKAATFNRNIRFYFSEYLPDTKKKEYLSALEISRTTGLEGKELGLAIEKLRMARRLGRINSKEEGLLLLENLRSSGD